MRHSTLLASTLLFSVILASPNVFSPFFSPVVDEAFGQENDTSVAHELLKRQDGCPEGYGACAGLGAAGLCCRDNTLCAPDQLGRVACCPIGAFCTGTIGGPAATGGVTTTPSLSGFVFPTTTVSVVTQASTQGFIIADSTTVAQPSGARITRSTVPNQYYPFAYIPTTYVNAAACSSAYTGCQTDLASCTAALAGQINGVTVQAPGGGMTVQGITARVDPTSATSICSSLSLQACSGLQVEACQAFGTGGPAAATAQGAGISRFERLPRALSIGFAYILLMTFQASL